MDERPAVHRIWIFSIVWLGQLVSTLGSTITGFALGIWVYQRTGSATQFGLIAFCGVLPSILFSPLAGALVDRWNHRWTMILSDFAAGLITLAMFLLLVTGRFEVWHIYVLSTLSSTFSAFQGPAYLAATTLLIPKQHLGRAGGMVQMVHGIVLLAAPVLGGLLLENIQLKGILLLDMAACLFALITLLSVHFPRASATPVGDPDKGSLLHEIAYGWTYLTSQPRFLGLLMFFAVSNFLGGIFGVLFGPLVLSFASPSAYGTILSIAGIGMLIGGLVMSVWGGPRRRLDAVFSVMLLCGLCMMIAGSSPSILVVGIVVFLFSVGGPILNACTLVIFQAKVAPYVQGRIFALTGAIASAALPLAYLVAGPLADYVFGPLMVPDGPLAGSVGQLIGVGPGRGIGLMFMVIGALTMIVTVVAYLYPRLRLMEDELPDAIPDAIVASESEPVPRPPIDRARPVTPTLMPGDATAYPWRRLGVLGTVIVMMITGAGWLYQKNGEWPVHVTQDPRNAAHEQTPAAAATPSDQGSVAERVRDPSDVAPPPSTPSTPPMQSEPALAEPSAAPEPAPPLPETVDTEADRGSYHAGTDALPHAPPPVGTPPAGAYTIQRGDTLIAIAAHFYGDASQWSVIAQANPEADPRRLRVGQVIKLPARPSTSE